LLVDLDHFGMHIVFVLNKVYARIEGAEIDDGLVAADGHLLNGAAGNICEYDVPVIAGYAKSLYGHRAVYGVRICAHAEVGVADGFDFVIDRDGHNKISGFAHFKIFAWFGAYYKHIIA